MTWVKLSTSILTDPDIGALSDAAFRAYIRALAYCGAHLTDGAVSVKATRTLFICDDVASELVAEGLWLVTEDGYRVRNYLNHQQSREQIEATREADRERKRLAAERRSAKDSVRNPSGIGSDSGRLPTVDKKRREEKRSEEPTHDQTAPADARPEAERVGADEFDSWWSAYPRKVGKQKARAAYLKARKRGVTAEELRDGLEASVRQWRREMRPDDKLPHPTTWLNEGRWEDDYTAPTPTGPDPWARPMFEEFVAPADEPAWADPEIPNRIAQLRAVMGSATRNISEVV